MKEALNVVMRWQLRNPGQTDTTEAIEQVRAAKEDGSLTPGELTADLMTCFLQLTIRPLFTKTTQQVTSQGRKGQTTVLPRKFEMKEEIKRWKEIDSSALDLLRWAITAADSSLVEKNWHAIVPPLLTIIDDADIKYKAMGCEMVKILLDKTPPAFLKRTGLGDIFEDALMPCLGYLPPLTPEKESSELMSVAYPALLSLSHALNDHSAPKSLYTPPRHIKLLDTLIRKGILTTYAFSPESVKIVTVLSTQLIPIISSLGIESIKHLPYLLSMLSSILTNPFGTAYPPLLLQATQALQALVLNAWPRMGVHVGDVLKCVCVPYLRVAEEGAGVEALGNVRTELKRVVEMLRAAVKGQCDFEAEVSKLVEADARLEELFAVVE